MKGFNFPTCSSIAEVEDEKINSEKVQTRTGTKKMESKPKEAHQEIAYVVFFNPAGFYLSNKS